MQDPNTSQPTDASGDVQAPVVSEPQVTPTPEETAAPVVDTNAAPTAPMSDPTPTMTSPSATPEQPATEDQPMVSKPVMIFAVIVLVIVVGLLSWTFFLKDMLAAFDFTLLNTVVVAVNK